MDASYFLILLSAFLLYILPAMFLIAYLGHSRWFSTEGIVLAFAASSAIYGLLGFVFARMKSYNGSYVWLTVAVLASATAVLWRRRPLRIADRRIGISRSAVVVWGIFACVVVAKAFVFEGKVQYPKGHDAGIHFVQLTQLLVEGTIPSESLGSSVPNYYFQGLYTSAGVLEALSISVPPGVIIKFFQAVVIGMYIPLVFVITRTITESSRLGVMAAIVSLLLTKPLLVSGTYAMALATFYTGVVFLLLYRVRHEKADSLEYGLLILSLAGLVVTHALMLQYFLYMFASILIWDKLLAGADTRVQARLVVLVCAGLAVSLAFFYLTQPQLFAAQASYLVDRIGVSGEQVEWQGIVYRESIPELVVWLLFPILLGPLLVGLKEAFKRKEAFLLGSAFTAAVSSLMQLQPQASREIYYGLVPLASLAAWGLGRLTDYGRTKTTRWLTLAVLSALLVLGIHQTVSVASKPVTAARSYVSDRDIEFARWLQESFPVGHRIASRYDVSNLVLEAYTNSKIIGSHRSWQYPRNFADMQALLYEHTTHNDDRVHLICQYGITAVLLDEYSELWAAFPYTMQYMNPLPSRHFYLLDSRMCDGWNLTRPTTSED